MKLIILREYDEASEWAAKYIRNRIVRFKPGPDRFFTLGLPTGTSPHSHLSLTAREKKVDLFEQSETE